jgi:hypothetical protein
MDSGGDRRKIQIVNRIYPDKESILNGFDLDCVCIGFDGKDVLATGRAMRAIQTRLNIVDLSIRGDAYENRLLKYAERGFAIAVPGLLKDKIDTEFISLVQEESRWNKGYLEYNGAAWSKWTEARHLMRLLLGDHICTSHGYIGQAFASRNKHVERNPDEISEYKILMNNAASNDQYPGPTKKYGKTIWPATMQLSSLSSPTGPFRIEWSMANMPRKPVDVDTW